MVHYLTSLAAVLLPLAAFFLLRGRIRSRPMLAMGVILFVHGMVTGITYLGEFGDNQDRRLRAIEYNLPKGELIERTKAIESIRWVAVGDRNLHLTMVFPISALVIGGTMSFLVSLKALNTRNAMSSERGNHGEISE